MLVVVSKQVTGPGPGYWDPDLDIGTRTWTLGPGRGYWDPDPDIGARFQLCLVVTRRRTNHGIVGTRGRNVVGGVRTNHVGVVVRVQWRGLGEHLGLLLLHGVAGADAMCGCIGGWLVCARGGPVGVKVDEVNVLRVSSSGTSRHAPSPSAALVVGVAVHCPTEVRG